MTVNIQGQEVLTTAQMYAADAAAGAAGVSSLSLMEIAGFKVANEIRARWSRQRVAVLCGPGNNGGDGFVVARLLRKAGWPVRLGLLGDVATLKGDAAINAGRWVSGGGKVEELTAELALWGGLAVDALFGAGLSRPLDGIALEVVSALKRHQTPCVAIDMPSGVSGDTGRIIGENLEAWVQSALTVTFFRPKPGHLLQPGRLMCGDLVVADIGIPAAVLDEIRPALVVNGPGPWALPEAFGPLTRKYHRGLSVIYGSADMSGAARLAAAAARRVGAGLVKVCAPEVARPIYMSNAPGLMFEAARDPLELPDQRATAVLLGPGFGVGADTRQKVLSLLEADRATVLDADALTSFANEPESLFSAIENCQADVVLTPHSGEFSTLFGSAAGRDKLKVTQAAAAASGAVVVFKGSDTVIAAPEGMAAISVNAPPWLATAGSGDVLAGLICGLLAQGMLGWPAACAGVWLHGEAAQTVGQGLIAEDLVDAIPEILEKA
ncbi:MAG: NAD(P)H-hydrate dehydratase [Alphaproteobacteria bacterium]|nr:NAD(P)H-hydrate dehydratase [Alphaproteobacteria bacterium]